MILSERLIFFKTFSSSHRSTFTTCNVTILCAYETNVFDKYFDSSVGPLRWYVTLTGVYCVVPNECSYDLKLSNTYWRTSFFLLNHRMNEEYILFLTHICSGVNDSRFETRFYKYLLNALLCTVARCRSHCL